MVTYYWRAYPGRPNLTPSGAEGVYVSPPGPTVLAVSPANDTVDVPEATPCTAPFDQHVTGRTATSFTVPDVDGLSVPGTVSYSTASRTATFTPSVAMEPGTTYKASLSN